MSESQSGRKHSQSTKNKMSKTGNGMYGVHRYGTKNPFYRKNHTDAARLKMRLAACNRLVKNGVVRSYNIAACKFIDEFGKNRGYNFQHALNGGEVEVYGYFLDGYDKDKNVVFEYDEPRHYINGILRNKDLLRMNEIKSYLGCKFIRYNEYTEQLHEF